MLLAGLFLHEQIDPVSLLASLVALIGVFMVVRPSDLFAGATDSTATALRILGSALALGAAFCSSCAYLLIRVVGLRVNPAVSVFYFGLVVSALAPLEGFVTGKSALVIPGQTSDILITLGVGLSAVCGNSLLSIGLQRTAAGEQGSLPTKGPCK